MRDVETLKAVADPLRQTILSLLDTARTVKDVSAEVGKPPDRLYYHLGLLERHGLVRAIEERGAERRYVVAADEIEIDPAITMPAGTARQLVSTALDEIRGEYARAIKRVQRSQKKKQILLARKQVALTEDERAELMQLLEHVTDRFVDAKTASGDGKDRRRTGVEPRRTYGVVTGMWPLEDEDTGR